MVCSWAGRVRGNFGYFTHYQRINLFPNNADWVHPMNEVFMLADVDKKGYITMHKGVDTTPQIFKLNI